MNLTRTRSRVGRPLLIVVVGASALLLVSSCRSTRGGSTRGGSTTIIQPPSPFGLPKVPALRLRNPDGLAPPSLGSLIRVVKDPPPGPSPVDVLQLPPGKPPFPGAVWQQGYWIQDGGKFLWIEGRWEKLPEGYSAWEAPRWEERSDGWVFVPGRWR